MGLFWGSQFYSGNLSILMPVPHCFDDSFVVKFESEIQESFNFFFFKVVLTSQGHWQLHMDFRISFSIFAECRWNFGRDYIASLDCSEQYCHLHNLSFSIQVYEMSFHFMM